MSLSELYSKNSITISCELFPPRTDRGVESLMANVGKLMSFSPDFFTCTYGAGGSSRDRTLEILRRVKAKFEVPVASHLTIVGSTVDQLRNYLNLAHQAGIDHIVALRGDPPEGTLDFVAADGGLKYANELVELIRSEYSEFGVAVAGYPEVHQEAPSAEVDLDNLKRKVDAGADIVITQLFYENADYLRFRDRCRSAGISVPIVPGIMPVTNLKQIQKIASLCGAALPSSFVDQLSADDDPKKQFEVGVSQAITQIADLIDEGVDGLHFYVLNKSDATSAILRAVEIASRLPTVSE